MWTVTEGLQGRSKKRESLFLGRKLQEFWANAILLGYLHEITWHAITLLVLKPEEMEVFVLRVTMWHHTSVAKLWSNRESIFHYQKCYASKPLHMALNTGRARRHYVDRQPFVNHWSHLLQPLSDCRMRWKKKVCSEEFPLLEKEIQLMFDFKTWTISNTFK